MRRWWLERRARKAEREAFMRRLNDEYSAALRDRDPGALEASRDYSDHDGTPWRVEAGMGFAGLALIVFALIVLLLVGFFSLVKAAINGGA
jgi:hypothetical protein